MDYTDGRSTTSRRTSAARPRVRRAAAVVLAAAALAAAVLPGAHAARPQEAVVGVLPPPVATRAAAGEGVARPPSHPSCHTGIPRASKDRPDVHDGRLVHVVYLVAADAPDERLDALGVLDCSLVAQNEWFERQTGGLRWRFDTFRTRVPNSRSGRDEVAHVADVTFVRSSRTMGELSNGPAVERELVALGLDEPGKRYLSYVAGGADGGACGDATLPLVSSSSEPVDGKYAQVYLFAAEGCRTHEFGTPGRASFAEMVAQQEIIHNDGIVSAGAPHACLLGTPPGVGHVCTGPLVATEGGLNLDPERVDVMYPFVSLPLSEKVLDPGRDDYFTPLLPNLRDLSDSPYLERRDG